MQRVKPWPCPNLQEARPEQRPTCRKPQEPKPGGARKSWGPKQREHSPLTTRRLQTTYFRSEHAKGQVINNRKLQETPRTPPPTCQGPPQPHRDQAVS